MEKVTKAIGYARVSTLQQDLDRQIKLIKGEAEKRNYILLGIYAEKISGKTFERPQYHKMLSEVPNLDVQIVLVSDFDRFSRAKPHSAQEALDELVDMGLSVIGIIDGMYAASDSTLEEELFVGLRLNIAWYERRKIRQRLEPGYYEHLDLQRAGKLPKGKRPIGRQPYKLTKSEKRAIRLLIKDGASGAYIFRHYLSKRPGFGKMTLNTTYPLLKRHNIILHPKKNDVRGEI